MMGKINNTFSLLNSFKFRNVSQSYKIIFIFLLLFVISLPFNGIELDLISISRLEIKITMFTFSLLFIAWLLNSLKSPRKRSVKEKLFYTFAFMYGISQFASLVNSPMPFESIKQGIIIFSLLTMMIVVSETVLDKKIAISVLTTIGIVSLVIGIIAVVNYYFFTDFCGRLGQENVLGIVDLGGDPYYFGDLLLYSLGSVLFVILNLSKKKYWRQLRWPLLMIWFSAIVLTCTKALIVAVICLFLCLILILKKKRAFAAISMVLFIITMIVNFPISQCINSKKRPAPEAIEIISKEDAIEIISSLKAKEVISEEDVKEIISKLEAKEVISKEDVKEIISALEATEVVLKIDYPELKLNTSGQILERLDIFSFLGKHSLYIRGKAIIVSLIFSMEHFWFGNGAGLSQRLLPKMGNHYDKIVNEKTKILMREKAIYGENANVSLIDAHNLYITEFFNVGILGLISLIFLTTFVLIEQIKTIRTSYIKNDNINEFLFATIISMLILRTMGSLIVIPSLWFLLGLCFGVSKLYRNSAPASNS